MSKSLRWFDDKMKVYKGRLEVDGRLEGMDYPTDWEIAEATTVEARYVVAIHHTFLEEKWFIRAFEGKQEAVGWCGAVVMDEEVNIGIIFHNNGRCRWYVSMVMEKEKRNKKEDSINNLRKEVYKMDKNSLENYAGTDYSCV